MSAFDQLKVTSPASVDVTQSGTPSVGRYSIEVTSLAASQVLASPSFSSPSATVGTGTLTIQVGTPPTALDQAALTRILRRRF